ncbi:unnamed protein product [Cuscuta campestris]|uniref:Uncharacterized protein n=1 Tax=Cuscuta campestris TaxID=132261 RepID=A0A484KXL0_9ASTE|nr:unnamed protein product [Cuscuta campestris]
MDQQIAVPKFGEYGATAESGVPNSDKPPPVPGATKVLTLQEEGRGPTGEASKICGSKRTTPDCPVTINSGNGHLVYVRRRPEVQTKDISKPETLEIPKASLLPAKQPSAVSSSSEKCNNVSSNLDNVHLLDTPKRAKLKQWEERYCRLQNLLSSLDQSKQEDYIQMLRSLSSVELSKHAVELEKRAIQLAFEEAKEMRWVKVLDVMGKDWNSRAKLQ